MVYSLLYDSTMETGTSLPDLSLQHSSVSTRLSDLPSLPEEERVSPGIEALVLTDLPLEHSFSKRACSSFNCECAREDSSPETRILTVNHGEGSSQYSRNSIRTQAVRTRRPLATSSRFSTMNETDAQQCRSFGLKGGNDLQSLREDCDCFRGPVVPDLTREIHGMTSIAGGGYCTMYRARWTKKQSRGSPVNVVVKIIPRPERDRGDKVLKRLKREIERWSHLNHTNIAPLLGLASGKLGPGLVSPWYSKGNILQYIQRVPHVPREPLCTDVASGLRYLHEQDPPVIHGNLQGINILVDMDGRAALYDFGLSTILDSSPTDFTSFVLGNTLRFKAPEEFASDLEGGSIPRDVYSYACVYGQIMTGDPPFHWHRTDLQIMHAIRGVELPYRLDSIISRHTLAFLEPSWDPLPACRPTMSNICHALGIPADHPSAQGR